MRFDVVGNLPAELNQLIFQQLDLCQVFQCRRVSRTWSAILCDESLIRAKLEPWRLKGDFKLEISRGTPSKQALDMIAEHEDAFRTGNVFSKMTMAIPYEVTIPGRFSYSEGYLAWWDNDMDVMGIAIYHIKSGKRFRRVMPERETINCLAVSSTLLAVVSYGAKCYVWAHNSESSPCSVRLPSAQPTSLYAVGDQVVLCLSRSQTSEPENQRNSIIVIHCAAKSQQASCLSQPLSARTCEFPIDCPYKDRTAHVTMDRMGKHVIVVHSIASAEGGGLYISHYDLKGKLQFEGLVGGLQEETLGDSAFNITESCSAKSGCFFNIWSLSRSVKEVHGRQLEEVEYMHAIYDPARRTIQIQSQSLFNGETRGRFDHPILLHKGILYDIRGYGYGNRKVVMRIVDPEKCLEGSLEFDPTTKVDPESRTYQSHGDEVFLVQVCDESVEIWCFDKHVHMVSENPEIPLSQHTAARVKMQPMWR